MFQCGEYLPVHKEKQFMAQGTYFPILCYNIQIETPSEIFHANVSIES